MTAPYDVGDVIEARRKYNDGLASAGRRERATWFPWALAAILAVLPLMQLTGGGYNYLIHIVLYAMMYAAMASSWNILGGYTGYISLGHNVFFCIGGYFSGIVLASTGVPSILTAPLAGMVAAGAGYLIALVPPRLRGPPLPLLSIAPLCVARILFSNCPSFGVSQS